MASLTAGFWPFGYPASEPKYAAPRTSVPLPAQEKRPLDKNQL